MKRIVFLLVIVVMVVTLSAQNKTQRVRSSSTTTSSSSIKQEGEIKFVNECKKVWITVYVDGIESGSIPPGDSQTTTASLGKRKLKAVTVESSKKTLTQDIELKANGYVWTVSD